MQQSAATNAVGMPYRPEIDGLRAIAVLAVVLSHAGVTLLPGGFLGVDVFFVISGFLITTLIHRERNAGQFRLRGFFLRRVRRLLPALLLTLALTLALGALFGLPSELREIGYSAAATLLLVSNFYFMDATGYFSEQARNLPLLHMWSLSIEEQFYLLFPLLFLGSNRRLSSAPVLLLLAAASLILAVYGAEAKPTANYFFSPSRFWELLAGAVAARSGLGDRLPRALADLAAGLGLAAVLASLLFLNELTPTPSLWTLPPVLGTCLFLVFARPDTRLGRMMTLGPLRLVGLSSYSIYLLHQPILSFARLEGTLPDDQPLYIAVFVLLILAAGFASWAFVERPFRRHASLAGLGLLQVGLLGLSLALALTALPQRLVRPEDRALVATEWREARSYLHRLSRAAEGRPFADNGAPKVLVIGDSYGKDFVNALSESSALPDLDLSFHEIASVCGNLAVPQDDPALVGLNLPAECDTVDRYQSAALIARIRAADFVVLGSAWMPWHLRAMDRSLERITSLTEAKILLLGPKSLGFADLRRLRDLDPAARFAVRAAPSVETLAVSTSLSAQYPTHFVDIQMLLCPEASTEGCPVVDATGAPISYDGSHLTPAGARLLGERLENSGVLSLLSKSGL